MAYGDLVQSAQVATSSGASVSLAYATTPLTGSTLFAAGASGSNTTGLTLASANQTWTQQAEQSFAAGQVSHRQAYVLSHVGGAETVNLTVGQDETILEICEFSGTSNSAPLTATGGISTGSAITTSNITVTSTHIENGSMLLVASSASAQSATVTPTSPWVEAIDQAGLTSLQVQTRAAATATTYANAATWSGSVDWFSRIMAFKPAAGGAAFRAKPTRPILQAVARASEW